MAVATIEMEFSAGVWTDVNADVMLSEGVHWERGIKGSGPQDSVAGIGVMTFALNNSAGNSGSLNGYYSPGHANVRSGFGFDMSVRIKLRVGSTVWYHFLGRVKKISPVPGTTSAKPFVYIEATDWMDRFSEQRDLRLVLRESYRSDQGITDLVGEVSVAPQNTSYETGADTYTFMFDDVGDEAAALTVAHDICQSERGFLYVRGNATDGESLKFENRHTRAKASSAETLAEGELIYDGGIEVPSDLARVFNIVSVAAFPRKVDTSNVKLVNTEAELTVLAGETETVLVDFRDPNNEAVFVGGKTVVTPAATTDWTANSTSGGGGSNVSSDIVVVATKFGARVEVAFTNNGVTTAYIRGPSTDKGFDVRGLGLYRYSPIVRTATNTTSTGLYGDRPMPVVIEMPYQDNPEIARDAAAFIANLWGGVVNLPTFVRPKTSDQAILERCLDRDIGDRITVSESVTAVGSAEVFIQRIIGDISSTGVVLLGWEVAPADTSDVLILDDAVAGKLDTNALAY